MVKDNREELTRARARIEKMEEQIMTLATNQAYNAGTSDALKERVEGIDNYGSRRWIKGEGE